MAENRGVWTAIGGAFVAPGIGAVMTSASGRNDPIFWIGIGLIVVGASIWVWLLVSPRVESREKRRERAEHARLEGLANQRDGFDEIARELGQISSQLKAELRWGERRGDLFPNTAWAKNQHLVTGETRELVESAYEWAHQFDQETLSATPTELAESERDARLHAKPIVDSAAKAVADLRDEVQLRAARLAPVRAVAQDERAS